ncbi:hypothetical protein A4X06_0g150 [Tilletia controversa]|uniref:Uncharacterized protein n=1 Tax=Tilletia controversa TaxID=13291 RepID=A0A8X7T0Y1_9BASI|nr:hypothetical protein CF328_g244 [Tilletia controversa]KAE8255986.1 hypothetical protein A4X06_0g150 [Tilletia controversa]
MYSSSRGYQHMAAPPPQQHHHHHHHHIDEQDEHEHEDEYDVYQHQHRPEQDGDLGLPAPHCLPGNAYPGPPRAVFTAEPLEPIPHQHAPSSIASSGAGPGPAGRSHRGSRTFSLPPGSPSLGAGVGTYARSQGAPPSESSSRRTRNSLPPPNAYTPYGAHPQQQYGYAPPIHHMGHDYGYQQQQAHNDPYAMPNYLYEPTPGSGGAPSVSSGASGSASRHGGIFAVSAPHHSQGPRKHRSSAGGPPTLNSRRSAGPPPGQYHGSNSNGSGNGNGNGMTPGDVLPPFPPWSMAWYAGHVSADGHAYTMVPPQGSGGGDWESDTLTSSGYASYPQGHPHHYRPHHPGHPYPYGAHQQPPPPSSQTPIPIDPEAHAAALKAARLRALEREFGLKVDGRDPHHDGGDDDDDDVALLEKGRDLEGDQYLDEDEILPPGSIDSEGKYVHGHPKMRSAVGIALLLLCAVAFAVGAGGAYLIKVPPTTLPSSVPAKGSIGSYLLYVFSFLCLALSFYLTCIRPCCTEPMRRRKINNAALVGGPGAGYGGAGGFVMPVMSGMGGKGGKPPKMAKGGKMFGKKGKQQMMGQAPTVNVIVDPRAFMGAHNRGANDDDDDDDSTDEEEVENQHRLEKDAALSGPENVDLAGLIGGRLGATGADGSPAGGGAAGGGKPLTKKQRKRQRRAARLRAQDNAARRALFLPLVLGSLRTQAVWLTVQSILWLLAVIACLAPLFAQTQSSTVTFVDVGTNSTFERQLNSTRTILGSSCKPRMGAGWCDAYNGARAAAVIAMVVCMGLATWAMKELGMAKKMAMRERAGFRVR